MYRVPFLACAIATALAFGYESLYEHDFWRQMMAIGLSALANGVSGAIYHFNQRLDACACPFARPTSTPPRQTTRQLTR
ncbi:MAG TPA: hypothetical protein VN719_09485 [Gemmatimonadales bacterium]|nr:hypothetical protein [Gemmatimonadales bacterium]